MLPCNKRQKVVQRPSGLTLYRCMNNKCGLHGSEIEEQNCSTCPVRSVRHERSCKKAARAKVQSEPVTTKEMLDLSDEDVREMVEAAGMDVGDLDKAQKYESGELPPGYPPMSMQLWTYKEALIKWQKAGRPTRTQEEVEQIHKEFCEPCEWYDAEQKRCKGCGCKVTVGSVAIFNKLKMSTEHCPKDKF